jgi:ParB family chromosome partitioning protein
MQPIVVRRVDGGGSDGAEYELIAGERRWRASKIAGLGVVPAIVRDVDDVTSAQLALIENVQREDLNVVELAEGYRALADRYGMTQEKISNAVGVSRSSVANIVRLLELPEEVRALISGGALSSGHGKVLLSLGSPEKQRKFAARAIKEGWNVRLLERAIDDENGGQNIGSLPQGVGKKEDERALSVLRDLEVRVGEQLGTRVRIKTDKSRQKGRVVIEFYDLDQFDGLLGRLGVSMDA